MHDLPLPSLKIENYRLFDRLEIGTLGRVNLLTGKNNVGKTSLLEAVRLYAFRGSPRVILDILEGREELEGLPGRRLGSQRATPETLIAALKQLFHGRELGMEREPPIRIGPVEGGSRVSIGFQWYEGETEGSEALRLPAEGEIDALPNEIRPAIVVGWRPRARVRFFLDATGRLSLLRDRARVYETRMGVEFNCVSVPANGLPGRDVSDLWDAINLTPEEATVVEALRLITPDLDRVSISTDGDSRPTPVVRAKLISHAQPVPLRSMGDGLNRIFGITLALVSARDGVLLLDEVENGIHYTAQADLWRLVFKTAQRLNVQVFATTHSYDCITAFQQAARENTEEGVLIRLDRRDERVTATLFDEADLEVVAEEEIEVR